MAHVLKQSQIFFLKKDLPVTETTSELLAQSPSAAGTFMTIQQLVKAWNENLND